MNTEDGLWSLHHSVGGKALSCCTALSLGTVAVHCLPRRLTKNSLLETELSYLLAQNKRPTSHTSDGMMTTKKTDSNTQGPVGIFNFETDKVWVLE